MLIVLYALLIMNKEDGPNCRFRSCRLLLMIVIIPYFSFFIGFFAYIVYEYVNIYKNRNPGNLSNIKANPFLEDLLTIIKDRHPAEEYIFSIMICYSVSMAIFLLSWILNYILTKRYLEMEEEEEKETKDSKSQDFID